MTLRKLTFAVVCAALACASAVQAEPIFYLSTSNAAGAPGPLNLSGNAGDTGTLYLWGSSSDVRVGGISLDVNSSSSALAFTSAVYGPQNGTAWNLPGGPIVVSPSDLKGINGAALPPAGSGFGPGSAIGNDLLIAEIGYKLGASAGASEIALKVGENLIATYAGEVANVRFGGPNAPIVSGEAIGAGNAVGVANVRDGVIPEPATLSLVGLAIVGVLGFGRRRS